MLIGNDVGGVKLIEETRIVATKPELIDIGVNLTHRSFDRDREDVITRAREAGVNTLVITGTTIQGSRSAAWAAKSRPGVLYATAGVHPHHAKDCNDATIADLRALAAEKVVVAIGECGLDFNRNFSPPAVQEKWFEAQLELAADLKKPVFMHERDAWQRFLEIMARRRQHIAHGVVHCFTGTERELRGYLDLDLHIGITGWICDDRRGKHLLELVKMVPLERLMLETDAPFLLPHPHARQDRRNEPAFLARVLEVVAGARGQPAEEVARATTATARAFFGLP